MCDLLYLGTTLVMSWQFFTCVFQPLAEIKVKTKESSVSFFQME